MKITLSKGFKKTLKLNVEKYTFDVGILDNQAYSLPVKPPRGEGYAHSTFAGDTVRKKSRIKSDKTIADIFKDLMKSFGVNFLSDPFNKNKSKNNKEILDFANQYIKFVFNPKSNSVKRLENLIQAIIRNPILRQDYGSNSALTQKIKGFDRLFIDTGQTFKSIRARAIRVRR